MLIVSNYNDYSQNLCPFYNSQFRYFVIFKFGLCLQDNDKQLSQLSYLILISILQSFIKYLIILIFGFSQHVNNKQLLP